MFNLRLTIAIAIILFFAVAHAYDVVFDPNQEHATILELNDLAETYRECQDNYINGTVRKVRGNFPKIEIYLKSLEDSELFVVQLHLNELDMVTLKSLDTLIFPGSLINAYIQRCGSGAIPYLISITKLGHFRQRERYANKARIPRRSHVSAPLVTLPPAYYYGAMGWSSGCGTRGGPGWRKPNGKCASWQD